MLTLYYLRVFFISFEFLTLTLSILLYPIAIPSLTKHLLPHLKEDILNYILISPVALAGLSFTQSKKVLFPISGQEKILLSWPGYKRLKAHFHIGNLNTTICALIIISLNNVIQSNNPTLIYIIFFSTTILLINIPSIYLAEIKIRELLIMNS